MKKIPIYIFIIIILTALFSPTFRVQVQAADAPTGNCVSQDGSRSADGVTDDYCQKQYGPNAKWTQTNPPPAPPTKDPFNGATATGTAGTPTSTQDPRSSYHLLQQLPGVDADFNTEDTSAFGKYVNIMISITIGLAAVLAVVMIVIGGIEYSTSELTSSKEAGKEKIKDAILGLLLALGAYVLLYTVNPDLLNSVDLAGIKGATLNVTLQDFKILSIPVGGTINSKNASSRGTVCDANSIISAGQPYGLTNKQAETFSCILYFENRGCTSVKNYKWDRGQTGFSAFGYFQINLIGNAPALENQACRNVIGGQSPDCKHTFSYNGTPENNICIKAASDFNCQVAAATYLVKRRLSKGQPEFADWTVGTASESHANQASCVN